MIDAATEERIARRAGAAVRDFRPQILSPAGRKADRERTYRAIVARVVEAVMGDAFDAADRIVEDLLDRDVREGGR